MMDLILSPTVIYSRRELKENLRLVPTENGIYFWWIKNLPEIVPLEDCIKFGEYYLVYSGISPDKKGKPNSKSTLKIRLKTHYSGNAEGSTLRRTLGILLAQQSGFPLRRVGSGKRMTFTHLGEQWLDQWMDENTRISWVLDPEPWVIEENTLKSVSLPLNLKGNEHVFKSSLSTLRKEAIIHARILEIANELGIQRKHRSSLSVD
ncbi:hypothetical protein HX005_16340 [Acinetobacter sp. R933-2]|uniref:GIY-YIG nuclease family protein n=1 Tax=Acinetobacter sp. R933-2 TaxID=2746728 RepID=UPI002576EBA3|nr:hypothetical protein [Acinetobacter sp. R933-2]MDM1248956.1 hypothetical protein [Acinetobacter sp. R933-2]